MFLFIIVSYLFQIFIYYIFNFQADITPNLESNAGLICVTYSHVTTANNLNLGCLYNLSFSRHNT